MFRFWASDSRGSGQTIDGHHHQLLDCADSVAHSRSGLPTPISPKRRRPSFVDTAACAYPSAKRLKAEQDGDLPSPVSASADGDDTGALCGSGMAPDLDAAKEAIQMQFGLEILLKHDELRLINQELAKCQVALEQLRRCHLIPYPLQCPMPGQMLHISNGNGPALGSKRGEPVPKWAPPFGVVEGPYARHYAKWLIPDPVFDGIPCQPQGLMDPGRVKNTAEGRATRSSVSDAVGPGKQRPVRGTAGQRLQALSSGYPQPKDKNSPCTVTKADGVVVKLICIDCQRWDFSSTQGFINHCRIAHKRDFKSHEEAAIASGHPIEVDERGAIVGDDHKPPAPVPSGLVHPLAGSESTTEPQAYKALLSRIKASMALYKAGRLPGVNSVPRLPSLPRDSAGAASSQDFVGSSDVPYLSRLMQKKKKGGNLKQQVTEAKTKVDWSWPSPDVDSETDEATATEDSAAREQPLASVVRTPAVMRMPSRAAVSPSHPPAAYRAASNKGLRTTTHGIDPASPIVPETPMYDDEMGVDLSPNTVTSNHAPSLVSDDGEYDDSDDGSASEASDAMETESVSDVAEININDDGDAREASPPPVSRRRASTTKAAKLKKDESRHVTFVSPTPVPTNNTKGKRKKI
jgi:ADA HAT complex component 1